MRVISGKYKGKRLFSPVGNSVRPTSDRIKETIFNILYSRGGVQDLRVLDLFAGSGALGIEALSRGASEVVFVDKDMDSVKLINDNLKHVGAACSVFNADFKVAIKKLEGKTFDLILLDPPYALKYEHEALQLIENYNILADDGIIFIEHSRQNSLINCENKYIIDTRDCGNTCISFITKAALKED